VVEARKIAKENDGWHRNGFFKWDFDDRAHSTDCLEVKLTRRSLLSDFDLKFPVNSNIFKG
jgi:hypothetical protein